MRFIDLLMKNYKILTFRIAIYNIIVDVEIA